MKWRRVARTGVAVEGDESTTQYHRIRRTDRDRRFVLGWKKLGRVAQLMAQRRDGAGPARAVNDRWQALKTSEDLALKQPMGRGAIAAAAEAMRKPRRSLQDALYRATTAS